MPSAETRSAPPWLIWVLRHRAWLVLLLTLLFVTLVRVRLLDMPLERDEGEYAYAGQLMLHGVAPYHSVYNMKLPGTYAAYAAILAVFGQTPAAVHLGLLLVNAGAIVLVFFIGRRILDDTAGAAAAAAYGLFSLSPSILGLAGHATHFVALPALGGVLLLLKALEPDTGEQDEASPVSRSWTLFGSALLFGLALVMKQHGLFFGLFGICYLLWSRWLEGLFRVVRSTREGVQRLPRELVVFAAGWVLPYLVTCLLLWKAGVLRHFLFWTVTYARIYVSEVNLSDAPNALWAASLRAVGPMFLLWTLPWAGVLLLWWDDRLRSRRFLLLSLLAWSIVSASVGFYYREHYFILVLPAFALLTGCAISAARQLLHPAATFELFFGLPLPGTFLGWPIFLLTGLGLVVVLIGVGPFWFAMNPEEASRAVYGDTLFAEAARAAQFIKTNTTRNTTIAVLGSEPEIYFLADRRAATGYIYTYPLMEPHPYAEKLQQEMVAEVASSAPEYIVFVDSPFSWLVRPGSKRTIFRWWQEYAPANLDLAETFRVQALVQQPVGAPGAAAAGTLSLKPTTSSLLVYKRKG